MFRHCKRFGFVLVTLDNDFSHTSIYPPEYLEDIVILRPKNQGITSVIALFKRFIENFDISKIKSSTIIVEEKLIRIRK